MRFLSPAGDILEVAQPDELGHGNVLFNGRIVESALYSDIGIPVTLGNGQTFATSNDWADYIWRKALSGEYAIQCKAESQ